MDSFKTITATITSDCFRDIFDPYLYAAVAGEAMRQHSDEDNEALAQTTISQLLTSEEGKKYARRQYLSSYFNSPGTSACYAIEAVEQFSELFYNKVLRRPVTLEITYYLRNGEYQLSNCRLEYVVFKPELYTSLYRDIERQSRPILEELLKSEDAQEAVDAAA